MRCIVVLILMITLGSGVAFGQHQEMGEAPMPYKGQVQPEKDSLSVLSAFKHGHVNGHFRYFFMHTNNAGDLSDYFANAAGGGLRFETASFHGFRFAVGGSYVFNIASSDLTIPDSTTGVFNRYEIGLFDITQPGHTDGIDRLEELHLSYQFGESQIVFGRQFINTPFLNLQDGRMRPGAVEGLVLRLNNLKWARIESGYIYGMSPRSTSAWYSIENSIGLYPSGVNPDGSKSDYKGNIHTPGIAYVGVTSVWKGSHSLKLWDVIVPDIMNTWMIEWGYDHRIRSGTSYLNGIQLIHQTALGNGGSENSMQDYYPEGSDAWIFSLKTGVRISHSEWSLQYSRVTGDGRYLMPREWGRDPIYTFMPRERNEGLGDVNAVVFKYSLKDMWKSFTLSTGIGYFDLPDVQNTRLNKYGLPSYIQANLDLRYTFGGWLEGFDVQYLLAAKINTGQTYDNLKYVINKVDMQSHNLVLNFHF